MTEAHGRHWASHRVLFAGLWLALMMLAIKIWIGWATQSLSLFAGALYTLVTCFSFVLSLLAVSAPFSRGVNIGHGRLEAGLTLLVTGFVGFAGCNLLGLAGYEFDQLFNAPTSQTTAITASLVQLLAAMTAVGLCSGFFGRYQARLLDSWSLAFSFNQSLLDAGLMVLIVAGLVGVSLGIGWLDPLVAALVVLLTLVSGWQVINRQLPSMMQQVAIAPESLIATIRQVEGILHCYDLRSRGMVGRLVYVEMRLILHPECLGVAQSIAERVERVIRHHYGPVKVVVHIDGDRTMAQPIKVLS